MYIYIYQLYLYGTSIYLINMMYIVAPWYFPTSDSNRIHFWWSILSEQTCPAGRNRKRSWLSPKNCLDDPYILTINSSPLKTQRIPQKNATRICLLRSKSSVSPNLLDPPLLLLPPFFGAQHPPAFPSLPGHLLPTKNLRGELPNNFFRMCFLVEKRNFNGKLCKMMFFYCLLDSPF